MKKCPNCGKYAENDDTICTGCYQSLPAKPDHRLPIGGAGIFVIILLISLLVFGVFLVKQEITNAQNRAEKARNISTKTTRPDDTGDRISSFDACRQFVIERLKAPPNAKFQNQFDSQVNQYQPGRWEIIAYIESFGATPRTYFMCKVKYTGNLKYELLELTTRISQ